jgi:hypothetical protein
LKLASPGKEQERSKSGETGDKTSQLESKTSANADRLNRQTSGDSVCCRTDVISGDVINSAVVHSAIGRDAIPHTSGAKSGEARDHQAAILDQEKHIRAVTQSSDVSRDDELADSQYFRLQLDSMENDNSKQLH